jgi:hypothetical protein
MRSSHRIKKLKISRDTRRYSASIGVLHSVGDGKKAWSATMVVVVKGPVSDGYENCACENGGECQRTRCLRTKGDNLRWIRAWTVSLDELLSRFLTYRSRSKCIGRVRNRGLFLVQSVH